MRIGSSASRGTRMVSKDGWTSRAASVMDSQHGPEHPVKEDAVAYAFYALLDDAELREVFGGSVIRSNTSD